MISTTGNAVLSGCAQSAAAVAAAVPREACNTAIDYSQVAGTPILPFGIVLDAINSNLDPDEGELQRFCYLITANGIGSPDYADLTNIIFSICGEITQDEITNVAVSLNGVAQTVEWGTDVELITDSTETCNGLRFNYPLNRVNGNMAVCFSLSEPRTVGPMPVCLYGDDAVATGLSICGPICNAVPGGCPTVAYQRATVCLPVTVTPFATVGDISTYCCGDTLVTAGEAACVGEVGGSCSFTISQTICVAIPVSFGADAVVGDFSVNCDGVTANTGCEDCDVEVE